MLTDWPSCSPTVKSWGDNFWRHRTLRGQNVSAYQSSKFKNMHITSKMIENASSILIISKLRISELQEIVNLILLCMGGGVFRTKGSGNPLTVKYFEIYHTDISYLSTGRPKNRGISKCYSVCFTAHLIWNLIIYFLFIGKLRSICQLRIQNNF